MNRTFSRILSSFVMALVAVPAVAHSQEFDIVIRGGKVVDGTGNPWFRADVGVKGDRVAAIGIIPAGAGKREIDAKGLVVAPGFVDIHSHSDDLLLEDGHAQSKIRQGVTTEILGEGDSAGPAKGNLPPRSIEARGKTHTWKTLGEYFDLIDSLGTSVNVASYVGLDNVWECVMGKSHARPTDAQIDAMAALVDEAMSEGALGLSSLLMMPPGSLATTDDIVRLCGPVKKHGGIFSSHIRSEGLEIFPSIDQAIAVGEKAGVPVDIIHLKIADEKLWGRMGEVAARFRAARDRGVNVQANVYPYTRGNNDLASIIPPWAHEGGPAKMVERLGDAATRQRLKKEITEGVEGWYNHYTAVGGDWSRMLVSGKGPYQGQTMDSVIAAKSAGKTPKPDPLDILFDVLIEQKGSVPTVYAHHEEKDMNLAMTQPWCSIGSDGSAYAIEGPLRRGNPHPRNFGTFPRVLGLYVRERGLLTLEEGVRKMTSANAAKVGLKDRGTLRPGVFGDITIFDPATVIDKSTYTAPFAYNEGIEYVIVNGQVVLEKGTHTGAMPGRALRHGR
ncbi:amidohydrolase family protein [bacterium]|nr:amidohydrolase family protein [bacterium]